MSSDRPGQHPLVRLLVSFLADLWSFVVFTLFSPPVRKHDEARDTSVTSLARRQTDADDPLERARRSRDLGSRIHEGGEHGAEDDVSDEFLSQLEQRTQQVKITLANLEAEKVRIEGLIAKLQPIVPSYEALLDAERQLSEAQIMLEGEAMRAVADDAPAPTDADHQPEESGNGGWSGSWNS